MSFSKNVKEELSSHLPKARHCQISELAGLFLFGAKNDKNNACGLINVNLSEEVVLRKFFTLLNKTLNIDHDVSDYDAETFTKINATLKLNADFSGVNPLILQQPCCKKSFIRGAFLAAGSVTDPNKSYHFEVVSDNEAVATQLMDTMNFFEVEAKVVKRGGKFVVYIKDGSQIVEILGVMGASHSVMELESIRVVKEVRGSINRKVNCETANISKTVGAAVRQIEDINLIQEKLGLDTLAVPLQEMAYIRLENPDTPLSDLGNLLDPPIGKSGVNHRLKRLSAIANGLREG